VKLRGQRFFLKELGSGALRAEDILQEEEENTIPSDPRRLNQGYSLTDMKILRPWTDMLPQLPKQHLMRCYGVTKIKDRYYQICDLIEDLKDLPF